MNEAQSVSPSPHPTPPLSISHNNNYNKQLPFKAYRPKKARRKPTNSIKDTKENELFHFIMEFHNTANNKSDRPRERLCATVNEPKSEKKAGFLK